MRVIVIAPAGGETTHECDDDITVAELRERLGAWRIAAVPNSGTPFPVMPMRDASLVARYAKLLGRITVESVGGSRDVDAGFRVAVLEQREVESAPLARAAIPPFQWKCPSCKHTHPDLQPRCDSCGEKRNVTLYLEGLDPDDLPAKHKVWLTKTLAVSGLQEELLRELGSEEFSKFRESVVVPMTTQQVQAVLGGGYPALKELVDSFITRR